MALRFGSGRYPWPLVTLSLLAACGGGSSISPQPAGPGPVVTPLPTVSPNPRPSSNGDAFTYAGTLSESFVRLATPAPSPSAHATPEPTATPWQGTENYSVTQNVSVTTDASYNQRTGLAEFTTDETDTGQYQTITSTAHAYVAYLASSVRRGGTDVEVAGTTSSDSNGVSLQSTYPLGNGNFDELPELAGARWTNSAARTQNESDPSGQASSTTYNADGTYRESFSYPEGGTASATTNADGSGLYQTPLVGAPTNSTLTISAPSNGTINGELTLIAGGQLPGTFFFSLPVWYPTLPPQAASDTFVDGGAAQLPATCNVAAAYTASGISKIIETRTRLDVIFGELDTLTQTSYVTSPYGVLCVVLHDDLKDYYDFSGQSSSLFSLAPTPIQITTTDETLALQSATLVTATASAHRSTASTSLVRPLPNAVVLGEHFSALLAHNRAQTARALNTAYARGSHK